MRGLGMAQELQASSVGRRQYNGGIEKILNNVILFHFLLFLIKVCNIELHWSKKAVAKEYIYYETRPDDHLNRGGHDIDGDGDGPEESPG